jgi:hypothetical protein
MASCLGVPKRVDSFAADGPVAIVLEGIERKFLWSKGIPFENALPRTFNIPRLTPWLVGT